ncbi:MipA/OmpV family protein [Sphingomonas sp. S1-29]|uniref:MipA/OmpV family protein n=1 Tax=Sphingomonas sp. S1-29 TaxID=2991074 RepID=UPI0022405679|nr:MipA/OmpV family protein [Sphingomonas sp. S1-29]UZK68338.1 MipA/OmpV family protein [Sphingomonas sp. S1-29]
MRNARPLALALILASVGIATAHAQDEDPRGPRRTRIALGPQLVPSYPGSDSYDVRPFLDVSRTRGDIPFAFEAPDESGGLPLLTKGRFQIGPAFGFEGRRRGREVGGALPDVGFTVELGGFAQYAVTDAVRVRVEARQGIGGHKGLIANISGDYVMRDADRWLFSIGPRLTLSNSRYNRAFFGVAPADAAASGLPAYTADGGLQAVGATAGLLRQLTPSWGVYGYTKYDRLVGDPGGSPLVREFGSRNQLSGGLALTYTFGAGVR